MIVVNGIDRHLEFNIFGIQQMQDEKDEGSDIANLYAMVWGGMEGWRKAERIKVADYTFRDVINAIDILNNEDRATLITLTTALFLESQAYKAMLPPETLVPDATEEEKKSADTII